MPEVKTATGRLTLLAHAPTEATFRASFPAAERLDDRGRAWAIAGEGRLDRCDRVRSAPEPACIETSAVLGLAVDVDDALVEWDLGAWKGRGLDDVSTEHDADVVTWLQDPYSTPHGGESLARLVARAQSWLAAVPPGHTGVIASPAVVRAVIVVVMSAPLTAFWRLDVGPMTVTDLRGGHALWTVRSVACSLTNRR